MGSYDGAEVCELIGIFMLSLIGNKYNLNNIGLYRDDGLAVFKNTSGSQSEKIKRLFKKFLRTRFRYYHKLQHENSSLPRYYVKLKRWILPSLQKT